MRIVNFYEFRNKVKEEILEYLPELGAATVYLQEILKNNGVNLHALQILKQGEQCSPSIYLESYYERYRKGARWEDIMQDIASFYWRSSGGIPVTFDEVLSLEHAKKQLVYRLVSYDRNEQLLANVPYIRWQDLAITFRWVAYRDEIGLASSLVTNELMKQWEVSVEELYEIAQENMQEQFPAVCIAMNELIDELYKVASVPDDAEGMEGRLYVLTNSQKLNGAGTVLYPGVLEQFSKEHNTDIYLLPSSIHEMILIPAVQGVLEQDLQEVVRHTNKAVLKEGDFLSNQIYYYERSSKQIRQI